MTIMQKKDEGEICCTVCFSADCCLFGDLQLAKTLRDNSGSWTAMWLMQQVSYYHYIVAISHCVYTQNRDRQDAYRRSR